MDSKNVQQHDRANLQAFSCYQRFLVAASPKTIDLALDGSRYATQLQRLGHIDREVSGYPSEQVCHHSITNRLFGQSGQPQQRQWPLGQSASKSARHVPQSWQSHHRTLKRRFFQDTFLVQALDEPRPYSAFASAKQKAAPFVFENGFLGNNWLYAV